MRGTSLEKMSQGWARRCRWPPHAVFVWGGGQARMYTVLVYVYECMLTCACTHICVYVCIYIYVCTCIWWFKADICCLGQSLSIFLLRWSPPLNYNPVWACSKDTMPLPSESLDYRWLQYLLLYPWVLRTWTSVLTLIWNVIYPLSYLPSTSSFLIGTHFVVL